MTITIPDKRKTYGEGRNWGMGFTFLKKDSKNNFTATEDFTCCKDFLNERFFTEHTNIRDEIFSYITEKKEGYFDNAIVYMGIKILPRRGDTTYNYAHREFKTDVDILNKNYKQLQKFMNYINDISGFKYPITIVKKPNNIFVVSFSKEWTDSSYLVSLISFLLRVGMFYNDEDYKGDFVKYLNDSSKTYNQVENGLLQHCIKILNKAIENKGLAFMQKQDLEGFKQNPPSIHNVGMCHFKIT
jgi:hypothetical protein